MLPSSEGMFHILLNTLYCILLPYARVKPFTEGIYVRDWLQRFSASSPQPFTTSTIWNTGFRVPALNKIDLLNTGVERRLDRQTDQSLQLSSWPAR